MSRSDEIRSRLETAFQPTRLDVRDDSARHEGHAGYQPGGESHFHITIASKDFDDMGRLARHRAIHEALGKDLMGQIHALAIKIVE